MHAANDNEHRQRLDALEETVGHFEELLTPLRTGFIYWIEPTTPSGVPLISMAK